MGKVIPLFQYELLVMTLDEEEKRG